LSIVSDWIFTDGHAKDRFTQFFNDLKDLDKIDWDIVSQRIWKNTGEDYDRQRRKQAEFLVRNHVPSACIEAVVVKDKTRKQIIEQTAQKLNLTLSVIVDSQNRLYYP